MRAGQTEEAFRLSLDGPKKSERPRLARPLPLSHTDRRCAVVSDGGVLPEHLDTNQSAVHDHRADLGVRHFGHDVTRPYLVGGKGHTVQREEVVTGSKGHMVG